MMDKLAVKQPTRMANRATPLLLHGNARPRIAQQKATRLEEHQLECLRAMGPRTLLQQITIFVELWLTSCKEKISTPIGQSKSPSKKILVETYFFYVRT